MMSQRSLLSSRTADIILLVLIFLLVACILILGTVPPTSRDALIHHLFIPKLYIQHGGMYEIPDLSWSYYPMNLDLLYTIPLYFGNDIMPKYIHFLFAAATSWLIYQYLQKRLNRTFGLIGSLFFLSIPIILKLSITAYVDLGLIFFSTASLLLLLKWIEEGFKLHVLLLAGVFCGLAVGTKYNGLITLFILTLFIPILYIRANESILEKQSNSARGLVSSCIFFVTALICFSPWIIRNFIWTNNPFFPLFNSWFNNQVVQTNDIVQLDIFSVRRVLFHESGLQILLIPLRVFFEGKDNNPQFFDGVLNPFLLLLPLFAFFKTPRNRPLAFEKYAMLAYVMLTFMLASFDSSMRIRYIAPIIPFLVILSVFGLENILSYFKRTPSPIRTKFAYTLGLIIVTIMLGYNTNYLIQQFLSVQPMSFLVGKVSREDYLSRFLPEYPVISYINKTSPANIKILALYLGNRGYYFNRPVEFDLQNNQSIFFDYVKQSHSPEEIMHSLQQRGITHLMIRLDLFENQSRQLLNQEKQILATRFFKKYVQNIFRTNQYGFFKLGLIE